MTSYDHVLDNSLTTLHMQHWSKLAHPLGVPWPMGRSQHAAVGLSDHHLLVTGGVGVDDVVLGKTRVLGDAWLLDLRYGRWREVRKITR